MSRPIDLASIHKTALRCKQEGVGLSECAIRGLVKSGDIPSVVIGNKSLVYWPNLIQFVAQGNNGMSETPNGPIRQVPMKLDGNTGKRRHDCN